MKFKFGNTASPMLTIGVISSVTIAAIVIALYMKKSRRDVVPPDAPPEAPADVPKVLQEERQIIEAPVIKSINISTKII